MHTVVSIAVGRLLAHTHCELGGAQISFRRSTPVADHPRCGGMPILLIGRPACLAGRQPTRHCKKLPLEQAERSAIKFMTHGEVVGETRVANLIRRRLLAMYEL